MCERQHGSPVNANAYCGANQHAHPNSLVYSDAHSYRVAHTYRFTNFYTNANPNAIIDAVTHPNSFANSDGVQHPHTHSHSHEYPDRDANPYALTHADPDQYAGAPCGSQSRRCELEP